MIYMSLFSDSVIIDKPAIYHILDGFLAEGIDGYTQSAVNNYLKNNQLNQFSNGEKVILYNKDDFDVTSDSSIISILAEIKTNNVSIFNIHMKTLISGHALALLIYYKKKDNTDEYHIFLTNSGFGIDHFESNDFIFGDMMIPFDYHLINDIKKVITLLEVIKILNSGDTISISSKTLKRKDLYERIKPYLKNEIEWDDIVISYKPTNRYLELNLVKSPYYYQDIIHFILGDSRRFRGELIPPIDVVWENTETVIDVVWENTETVIDDKFKSSNISLSYNEFVKKKLCFHTDFKIIPQQQGTCTWFCKYWALLIACILLGDDYSKYINRVYKCAINKLIEMLLPDDNHTFVSKITLETKLKNLGIITFNRDAKFINTTLEMSLPKTVSIPPEELNTALESLKQIIKSLKYDKNYIIIIVKFILKYPDFDPKSVLFRNFPNVESFIRTINVAVLLKENYLKLFLYLKTMYDKIIELETTDDNIYLLQIQILYIIIFFNSNNFYDTKMIKQMVIKYYYVAIYINIYIIYIC